MEETPRTALEQLQSSENVDLSQNKEKSSELIERYEIRKTPFHIVGNVLEGYFIAIANQRVSDYYISREFAEDYFWDNQWEFQQKLIIHITNFLIERNKNPQ